MAQNLRIGSSSWSASTWEGPFYPKGTPPAEYLAYYASKFDTVEIDATFYRVPSRRMVDAWRERTPPGFMFAAKMPQVITHEKMLTGCENDLKIFVGIMARLGEKLGPLLFQFRYFKKAEFPDPNRFIDRVQKFLPLLPSEHRFAIEVRNRHFVTPRLLELLHKYRVALAFIDHPWFFPIDQMLAIPDVLTTDFAYVRWLGDRYKIEEKTRSWDRLILDRTKEMKKWIPAIRQILAQDRAVSGYFNNHYAGYAVGSIRLFKEMWEQDS